MNKIDPWMFREKNEYTSLILSLLISLFIGYLLSSIDLYLLIGGVGVAFIFIKLQQAQLIGNALEVSDNQFPHLHKVFEQYKSQLEIEKVNLYIVQNPNPNAFTIGFPTASIILNSSIVENLSDKELEFIIAHELGHVKAGHNVILTFIYPLGNGIPAAAQIFGIWRRKAEYTSDKCAIILTRNIDAGISSLLKITVGLDIADKVNINKYREQLLSSKGLMVRLSEYLSDHPLTTNRIKVMVRFWKKSFKKQQ